MLMPMPANEMERLKTLSDLDLDYSGLQDNFKSLSKLAAKIAGTDISMVNLIDSLTQWTISNHGLELDQMAREDSVCQYTIVQTDGFEVKDLSADDRFKDKFYVTENPRLRYYYGVPLRAGNGSHLGALCVLDSQIRILTPEKIEMLKIIADEIVNRLFAMQVLDTLRYEVKEVNENQRRVAHDIRGPLGGIIGLARIISEQGDENTMEEVLEFINLIQKSGHSILELADEILSIDKKLLKSPELGSDEFNQIALKEKLLKLYTPQAVNKKIKFEVMTSADTQAIPFLKNKLLQIVGNIVSNAMKFTPAGGSVTVNLGLDVLTTGSNTLQIKVEDTGVGITAEKIDQILSGNGETTVGTSGEQGYGFGLALVKHLVDGLKGTLQITSQLGKSTTFMVSLPQPASHK